MILFHHHRHLFAANKQNKICLILLISFHLKVKLFKVDTVFSLSLKAAIRPPDTFTTDIDVHVNKKETNKIS